MKPQDQPGELSDAMKVMALEAATHTFSERVNALTAALGWALAHAHPMSTPEWRTETMIRAGWIPNGKAPEFFNN